MSITDYVLNGVLVALVVLQLRGRRLTPRRLLLPLVIVVWAAASYLHGIPTAGNDLVLVVGAALVGLVLGAGAGLLTRITPTGDGAPIATATYAAAVLWVLGIGARIAFSLYATNGGAAAIGRFSAAHAITSSDTWVAALVLMALAEVVSRTAVLALRSRIWVSARPQLG